MLDKVFSFKGTLTRKEYFVIAFVLPIVLFVIAGVLQTTLNIFVGEIAIVLALYIHIAATVKRARETVSSVGTVMFLWIFLTPVAILYLLFAPPKTDDAQQSYLKIFVVIFVIVVILGIVTAILIPKMVKNKELEAQKQTELSAKQRAELSESLCV